MVIGYLTMHFTFISLFMNMRTMGSKFWLGATVLVSSTFSLLLALATVNYLGVPINMVLMSEGLPFLVVTVGFEKPFMLTKAVLQGASSSVTRPTKDCVADAVREKGPIIIRDYLVEIAVLTLGAVSGVRGLRQFCFLAAWILGYDCILLFTFYTAILSIKLEVVQEIANANLRLTVSNDILLSERHCKKKGSHIEQQSRSLPLMIETPNHYHELHSMSRLPARHF
jgi:hydroxymethylglutaryl-CoA reductase (NADPH)